MVPLVVLPRYKFAIYMVLVDRVPYRADEWADRAVVLLGFCPMNEQIHDCLQVVAVSTIHFMSRVVCSVACLI
jgi:hypothetical protein